MTANQLRFWELRWKQHYDTIFLKLKEQEIAQAWAELDEKIRHNKKSEKQEQQRIIHERQRLELDWAKLTEQQRATVMSELFEDRKQQREEAWTKAQVEHLLVQDQVAVVEAFDSYLHHKNQDAQGWFDAEAKLLDKGWGKAAVGELVADVKGTISNAEYDQFMKNMAANLGGWFKEVYGPQANQKAQEWINSQNKEIVDNNRQSSAGKALKEMSNAEAQQDLVDKINKQGKYAPVVHGFTSTQNGSSSTANVGTKVVTGTATSRTVSSNPRNSGGGSSVVYSPNVGTRAIGPGL